MYGWTIVAIPEDDDPVWKLSSEDVPHLTLLYLGEQDDSEKAIHVASQIQHMIKDLVTPFMLDVFTRGTLGADDADVLFFDQALVPKVLLEFRSNLLKDNTIRALYDSAPQYPSWTPHLTLGYPETPAKNPPSSFIYETPKIVRFDRIALWIGDFDGPEFQLRDVGMESLMSEASSLAMSGLYSSARTYPTKRTTVKGATFMEPKRRGVTPSNLKHHGIGAKAFDHSNPILDALPHAIDLTRKSAKDIRMESREFHREYSGLQHRAIMDPASKYVRQHQGALIENLEAVVGGRPSERAHRRFDISTRDDGDWLLSSINTLEHTAVVETRLRPIVDSSGLIVDYTVMNSMLGKKDVSTALMHYGVKGMKWGVRKDRNKGSSGGDSDKAKKKAEKKDAKAARKQAKKEQFRKDVKDVIRRPISEDVRQDTRDRAKAHGTDALSNAELKAIVNRMNLEDRYHDLQKSKKGRSVRASGQKYVTDVATEILTDVAKDTLKNMMKDAAEKRREQRQNSTVYTPSTRVDRPALPQGRKRLTR